MKGWIPDALIPTNAPQELGGFPIDVDANQNQGFWVDVHLPRDQKNFAIKITYRQLITRYQAKLVSIS